MSGAISMLSRISLPGLVLRRALRVSLLPPELVAREWAAWQSGTSAAEASLRDPAQRLRRLIPLVDAGLRRAGVRLESPFKAFLRLGTAHEKMRWEAVERASGIAFEALLQGQVEFLVLRGLALAASVYPSPFFRHCHDLDLLVRPGQPDAAAQCLGKAGFVPGAPPPGSDADSRWMVDRFGFPVGIHVRRFRLAPWNRLDAAFPASSVPMAVGHTVRTLEPAEMLAAVCVHAATVGSVHSPCWVTDAWHLLAAYPALDWDRVLASGPALPLWLTLDWMQRELAAAVPAEVLTRLRASAEAVGAATMQQAAAAAMLCGMGRSRELLRSAQGAGERLAWVRRLAMPEKPILHWIEHSDAPGAFLHLRRLFRFAGGSWSHSGESRSH